MDKAVVGHKNQIVFFQNAIDNNQLSHAYIFSGPQGIGKKQLAKQIAKQLLCQNVSIKGDSDSRDLLESCNCPSCKQIDHNSHPDYYLYEKNEDLKIANIRNIIEMSGMTAYSGGWRVIILDNIHILSHGAADAANALLKTLEEPPQKTLFILITHQVNRVLPTIQSRCLNIPFEPLTDSELEYILTSARFKESEIYATLPDEDAIDWQKIVPHSAGSVSNAIAMVNLNTENLLLALDKKDLTAVGHCILGVDKNDLPFTLNILLGHFIDLYKESLSSKSMLAVQKISELQHNLSYNINPALATLDLYTYLVDALAE